MPVCCPYNQVTFNEAVTTINYTGDAPEVSVYYLIDGEYVAAGAFTEVKIGGGVIRVDHGGIMRGILKYS